MESSNAHNFSFAGFWIRVVATIVDILVLSPLVILLYYNHLVWKSLAVMVVVSVATALYKPLMEYSRGATIGKMVTDLRVISTDGGKISLEQSLLRYTPWLVSSLLSLLLLIEVYQHKDFPAQKGFIQFSAFTQEFKLTNINNYYGYFFILIMIYIVFDKKKQGLHDKLAGTYCVNIKE